MPVEYRAQARIGVVEIAFPAGERAEADVGEHLAWLIGMPGGEPPRLLEEFARPHEATMGSGNLMNRLPLLAEVANAATLLASDRASAMTAVLANVTCGSFVDL